MQHKYVVKTGNTGQEHWHLSVPEKLMYCILEREALCKAKFSNMHYAGKEKRSNTMRNSYI